MTEWFLKDDAGYLAWLAANPDGFVLNTWAHPRAGYLVLHRTTCRTIAPRAGDDRAWTLQYGKACGASVEALAAWSRERTGAEPSPCSICDPAGRGPGRRGGSRRPVAASPSTARRVRPQSFAGPPVRITIDRMDGGPRLVIDGAQWLAETFFRLDPSATGPASYDAATLSTAKDRFEDADVTALNRTMAARTAHTWWTDLLAADPSPILAALHHDWDLVESTDADWMATIAPAAVTAIHALRAPHREVAVVTKMLHLKRPALVPVLDSLVIELLGGRGRGIDEVLGHLRQAGRDNLAALREVQAHLATLRGDDGRPIERSLVRIMDAILWISHPGSMLHPALAGWQSTVSVRNDAPASFRLPMDLDDVGMSSRLLVSLPMLTLLVQCVAEADDRRASLALAVPSGGRIRVTRLGDQEDLLITTDHADAPPPYEGALHDSLLAHGFASMDGGYQQRMAFPEDTAFLDVARLIVGTFQHVYRADLRDAVDVDLRLGS